MARKPRDMTGTARCLDCGVQAMHERGPGTPLVIRHRDDCPNASKPPLTEASDRP